MKTNTSWTDDDGLVWHMTKASDGSDAIGFELDGSSIVVYREKPTDEHYRVVGENFDMVTGPLNTPKAAVAFAALYPGSAAADFAAKILGSAFGRLK